MRKKYNALDKLFEFKVELENQMGKGIKALWSDRGGKYMSTQFNSFLKEHKILS